MSGLFAALFIAIFVTSASSNDDFDKTIDIIQGQSIILPCELPIPTDGIKFYWELNDSKIANTTRRYQNGTNLIITRVDRERDSGRFTCIVEDTKAVRRKITISLNIHWIDTASVQLQKPESTSLIRQDVEVILRCHLDASGDVHFEWFRNLDRLARSDRFEFKKKRLHIASVQPSDNGIYRCIASNEAGISESTTNFVLAVPGDQTALIQTAPTNQMVKLKGSASFHCVYQHADVIEWYFKDRGPLGNDEKYTVHSNGTLQINNVENDDQGLYSCVGIRSESAEVPQSYTAQLKIAFLNEFTDDSFEPKLTDVGQKFIGENSTFQITCLEPASLPPAKKWWLNVDGHTVSDRGRVHVDDDGMLIIDSVSRENSGNYTCVAENVAGKTEKVLELIVTTKPEITSHPSSVTVEEKEQFSLSCSYSSDSEMYTEMRWKKDGKVVKPSPNQRVRIYEFNGTVVVDNAQTSDRGEYVCEIHTKGFDPIRSKPATVSIVETLKFSPPPVNKKLELGSIAKVHCKAQGTPPPIIRWEKDGISSENFPNHINDMNGTLHFNGVMAGDKGTYVCYANNSQGLINVTISIDVVVAPKFSILPKNPTEAIEGDSVMIDCVVEGDPKPTIQWDKNLKMNDFDTERFKVLENGTLFILKVSKDDENKYGCTAGSSAGLNRKEVQLIVHGQNGYFPEEPDMDSTVTKAVLITMSVAGAYIILVIGLMVWCRYRKRSRKLPVTDASKTENGDIDHADIKETEPINPSNSSKVEMNGVIDGQKSDGTETTQSQGSKKSKSNYDKLALSRTHLKEIKLIGRGEFGDVMIAKITKSTVEEKRNSQNEDKDLPVLVKALNQTKDENVPCEFKREIDMFAKLAHENVARLFGLCREEEPHYMILEYTDWGDLKQFLVATQKSTSPPLTMVQSVGIIQQLARGMEHLADLRHVHRDLAARNCLVTSKLVAKVSLPRLTKDPYSQEYCKYLNQVIPLRWLPYEAVYEDEYSTKSDVYSFGVVIWEILNQGELPFPKINDTSFLAKLKEKKLEWKSHLDAPEDLQKLHELCLDMDPQNRPVFNELVKSIEEILKAM